MGSVPSSEMAVRICQGLSYHKQFYKTPASVSSSDMVAGVRPRSKVWCAVVAGVRPQSKVAGDCTLAPRPEGCAKTGGCAKTRGLRQDPGAAPRPGGCAKTRGLRQSWGLRGALAVRGYSRGNWQNFAFWLLSKDKNVKNG